MTNLRDFPPLRVLDFFPVMERQTDSALVGRIIQLAFSLVVVGVGLYSVRGLMSGSSFVAKLAVLVFLGLAAVVALDDRYWLISAFLFGFQDALPLIKFTGMELGAIILIATFFVRRALHRDAVSGSSRALIFAAVPFLSWMCLVWFMHPVGMFIFGSSSIGGRFYLKVILAFMAMFCLFAIPLSEKGSRDFLVAFVLGNVVYVSRVVLFGATDQLFLAGSTHYQYAHLYYVAMFFLSRYSAVAILSSLWVFLGFLVSFGLTVYSGNRHSVGEVVLFGLAAPLVLKRERLRTFLLIGVASLFLAIVVTGHGSLWKLPFSVQRTVSFLPGRWDYRLQEYGFNDNFRATLRMYAREHIAQQPWFGDGGFSLDFSDMSWTAGEFNSRRDIFAGHILARNWHNVWLGMAADFGIPLSVAWAIFTGAVLLWGITKCRKFPPGSWHETAFLYFFLLCATNFVDFFFAGGHTAKTPERWFVWVGAMAAVHIGFLRSRRDGVFLQKPM